MLEEITIRDLGVIESAVLELSPGLTVLTGETGAGKTMVMTGLGLLLGERADAALIRGGAKRLVVEGRVRVAADSPVAVRAAEAGGELDDGVLILSRSVAADGGRSRAHVGGRSAPASVLAELAEDLVAVHGQHDQQRLLRPGRRRDSLDRFAGAPVAGALAAYRDTYDRLRRVRAELAEIVGRVRERAQEADLLRLGVAEIEAVAPEPGEDARLGAEVGRLAHADALREAATSAHDLLLADPTAGSGVDASVLVGGARRALEAMAGHDPALGELSARVVEVSYLLADVTADLASYAAGMDVDPQRLAAAQDRQAALAGLARKYGDTADDVLAWASTASDRLLELDRDGDTTLELRAEQDRLRAELARLAGEVSAARTAAAARFSTAVTAELAGLAMPQARLTVEVSQQERFLAPGEPDPDALLVGGRPLAFTRDGVDEVELLLRAHPGAPDRPLARGASGGELSRVMLAVQVVFADSDPVPTFVFDEVDAGVGGKAAVEVGRRLARLARVAQVVVVTHLPQVAAFADRHLLVEKSDDGLVTRTGVSVLTGEERVRELSRMLAGQEDSESARTHAQELLAVAASVAERD
jgi:DNA repair protein RecN (Recombination protein N)